MYYNTTHESGQLLIEYHQAATTQNRKIELFFIATQKPWAPSQVIKHCELDCPITSVRRAINTLAKAGKLTKTSQKYIGPYNRPEYLWVATKGDK